MNCLNKIMLARSSGPAFHDGIEAYLRKICKVELVAVVVN